MPRCLAEITVCAIERVSSRYVEVPMLNGMNVEELQSKLAEFSGTELAFVEPALCATFGVDTIDERLSIAGAIIVGSAPFLTIYIATYTGIVICEITPTSTVCNAIPLSNLTKVSTASYEGQFRGLLVFSGDVSTISATDDGTSLVEPARYVVEAQGGAAEDCRSFFRLLQTGLIGLFD